MPKWRPNATEKATPQEAPASEAVTPERLAQISELQIDLGTALLGLAADGPIVMGIGQHAQSNCR